MNPQRVRATLAYLSFVLLACSLIIVVKATLADSSRDVVMVLIGAIIAQSKEVFGFYFGTSQSSVDKNALLGPTQSAPEE